MHIWFWAWVLLTVILGAAEALDRRWYTLPFAIGTGLAALLEALGVWVGWQWLAFLAVSSAVFVGIQRFIRPSRKSLRRATRAARHGPRR